MQIVLMISIHEGTGEKIFGIFCRHNNSVFYSYGIFSKWCSSIAFLQTDLTVSNRSSEGHSEFSLLKAQEVIRIFRWHTPTNDIKWLYVPYITLKGYHNWCSVCAIQFVLFIRHGYFYFVKILFKLREFPCQIIILQITCLMTFFKLMNILHWFWHLSFNYVCLVN